MTRDDSSEKKNKASMLRSAAAFAPALLMAACAAPAAQSKGYITFADGRACKFAMTRDGVWGPRLTVRRSDEDPHTFVGWVAGNGTTAEVEMRVTNDAILGSHAGAPIRVSVAHRGEAVVAAGSYGSNHVAVTLLRDQSGACAIAGAVEGEASCASARAADSRRVVDLPAVMLQLPEAERAALVLAAFYD